MSEIIDDIEDKSEDESIEANPKKTKKPQTQKQIDAFALVRAKRDANRLARAAERELKDAEFKKAIEEKKALKEARLKKKQEKELAKIDEDSDEEPKLVKSTKKQKKARTFVIEIPDSDSDSDEEDTLPPPPAPAPLSIPAMRRQIGFG